MPKQCPSWGQARPQTEPPDPPPIVRCFRAPARTETVALQLLPCRAHATFQTDINFARRWRVMLRRAT